MWPNRRRRCHWGDLLNGPVLRWVAVALLLSLVSCSGVSGLDRYLQDTETALQMWDKAVKQWEAKSNDPKELPNLDLAAENSSRVMQGAINIWDRVEVPSVVRQYHRLIRECMRYEKEAFDTMAKYYSGPMAASEFDRLRRQAMELWNKKDEALAEALKVAPD